MENIRYETVEDLSDILKEVLPDEAKEIYLEAYQESWDAYEEWKGGEMGRDGVAHRNAMHAVLQEYDFDEDTGNWYKRGEGQVYEEEDEDLLDKVIDFFENLVPSSKEEKS